MNLKSVLSFNDDFGLVLGPKIEAKKEPVVKMNKQFPHCPGLVEDAVTGRLSYTPQALEKEPGLEEKYVEALEATMVAEDRLHYNLSKYTVTVDPSTGRISGFSTVGPYPDRIGYKVAKLTDEEPSTLPTEVVARASADITQKEPGVGYSVQDLLEGLTGSITPLQFRTQYVSQLEANVDAVSKEIQARTVSWEETLDKMVKLGIDGCVSSVVYDYWDGTSKITKAL